jgi:hypothetical protein
MRSFTSTASAYLEVISEIDRRYRGWKVVRQPRMKSYRNVWSAAALQAKNVQWQLVCANVFGLKWSH